MRLLGTLLRRAAAAALFAAAAAAILEPTLPGHGVAHAAPVAEYALKAEFVERFARFVEWPAGTSTTAPFVIGVIGKSPLLGYLQQIASARQARARDQSEIDPPKPCEGHDT